MPRTIFFFENYKIKQKTLLKNSVKNESAREKPRPPPQPV